MERPNTVAGLIEKRREIAGQIDHCQRQLRQLTADLDHLDATIRLFDPDADLASVGAKPYPPRHAAHKGEMARFVYAALRDADGPLTSLDIARKVMEGRGLDTADASATVLIRKRVGACLWKLRDKGEVAQVPLEGAYKGWTMTPCTGASPLGGSGC
jgi:hypothetical protein